MATAAAVAYIQANGETISDLNGNLTCSSGTPGTAVQALLNGTSVIWEAAGQFAGRVAISSSTQQTCPRIFSGAWD